MADWIDSYPWPGIIDLSDMAHLYEKGNVSMKTMLAAFGITEEEYNAALSDRKGVFGNKGTRQGDVGGPDDGVSSGPFGAGGS